MRRSQKLQKTLKPFILFFLGGGSRLFKVIDVNIIVLRINVSASHYVLNARRANNGKIKKTFTRVSFVHAFVLAEPHHPRDQKTKVLGVVHSKDFVILAHTVLLGLQSVTDTLTDGQTDRRLDHGKTRPAFCCRA